MSAQPSPELLNATGHALLRAIAAGHSAPLQAAAGALGRLASLLPDASPEGRLVAVLLAVTDDATSQPVVASPAPQSQPTPTPARRQAKAGKPVKQTRQAKPAHPLIDISGKLLSSREIGGVAVISQAEARKVLGMNCPQMIKLENQKLLTRIQEPSSRLVHYSTSEVQRLLDLIDRGADPESEADDDATDGAA